MGKTKTMGNTSFAGLGGGAVAGAAVAIAVAIGGYIIYEKAADNPPEDQTVEAVLQPKPASESTSETPPQPETPETPDVASSESAPTEIPAPIKLPAQSDTPAEAMAEVTGPEQTGETATAEEAVETPKPDAIAEAATEIASTSPDAEEASTGVPSEDATSVEPETQTAVPSTTEPAADTSSIQTTEAAPEAIAPQDTDAPTSAPLDPPRFDVVRVDAEGNALVAGTGVPDSSITVLLDRAEIATTAADHAGKFVALFDIAPSNQPRRISLLMTLGDLQLASVETALIEPLVAPKPVVVAEQPTTAPTVVASAELAEDPENTPEQTVPASNDVAVTPEAVQPEPVEPTVAETAPAQPELAKTAPAEIETAEALPKIAIPSEITEVTEASEAPAETAPPVAEPEAPRVLIADEDGVRVLSDPAKQAGISIDTISYTASGNAVVAGRGQVGAVVRIYLNGSVTAEAPVTEAGTWTAELQGVTPGVYTLRADQLDAQGAVTSRVETPFKRESQEVLAAVQAPVANAGDTGPAAAAEGQEGQDTNSPTSASIEDVAQINVVTVQPGFTLWGIAAERYGDGFLYVKVFDANADQIRNPDLIYPGQVFTVPE